MWVRWTGLIVAGMLMALVVGRFETAMKMQRGLTWRAAAAVDRFDSNSCSVAFGPPTECQIDGATKETTDQVYYAHQSHLVGGAANRSSPVLSTYTSSLWMRRGGGGVVAAAAGHLWAVHNVGDRFDRDERHADLRVEEGTRESVGQCGSRSKRATPQASAHV